MEILKKDYIIKEIKENENKKEVKEVLTRKGNNIFNFSKFVHKSIEFSEIKNFLFPLLKKEDLKYIKDIIKRLHRYDKYIIKSFEKDFEKRLKQSIFEFSIASLVIMERRDFQTFEDGREKCQNRKDKVLYHGTQVESISSIFAGFYKKSDKHSQHGKGVYFTTSLDCCWFYGGEKGNRYNINIIPQVGDTFTFIANATYYNKNCKNRVVDFKYTPKTNEINYAYANANTKTIQEKPDKTKFYAKEYVIWDLKQICPFLGALLKRREYCIIWRDPNFSSKSNYPKGWNEKFKQFLDNCKDYIYQYADQNLYTCETTDEALGLVNRKKYNKIILISNIGQDLEGIRFIEEARNIINNKNVIALFVSYDKKHISNIARHKNSLFINNFDLFKEYINCFSEGIKDKKNQIMNVKQKIEEYYRDDLYSKNLEKFNLKEENDFLYFPKINEAESYTGLKF